MKEADCYLAMLLVAGDTQAWDELYNQSNKIVAGYARKYSQRFYLANISDEDITSEAYSRAYKRLGTFKGYSRFSTWICGFVKYIVWAESRKQKRRRQIFQNYISSQLTFHSRDPCDIILELELYKSVWSAFERLQPLEAYILENRIVNEKTFFELSKDTQLPIRIVKKHYQTALDKYSKNFHIIYHDKGM